MTDTNCIFCIFTETTENSLKSFKMLPLLHDLGKLEEMSNSVVVRQTQCIRVRRKKALANLHPDRTVTLLPLHSDKLHFKMLQSKWKLANAPLNALSTSLWFTHRCNLDFGYNKQLHLTL